MRRQALSLFPPPQLLAHASHDAQPVFVEVAPGVFFFNSGDFLGSRPMPRKKLVGHALYLGGAYEQQPDGVPHIPKRHP